MTQTATCRHRIVRVVEFNVLGAEVSCLRCKLHFQLPDPNAAEFFIPFSHTSPRGKDHDISLLVHRSLVKEE